MTKLVEIE